MNNELLIVGLGPGPLKYLTQEAREELLRAKEVYFRQSDHPVFLWLRGRGTDCVSFDPLYAMPGVTYDDVYRIISRTLIKAASSRQVVYALPGNASVFERTTLWLREEAGQAGIVVRMVVGLSFMELIYQELGLDPESGLQVLNGFNFGYYGDYPFTERLGMLIGQVGFPTEKDPSAASNNAGAIARALLKKFPASHPVTLVWSSGMPECEVLTRTMPLRELSKAQDYVRSLAALYVPPVRPPWEWVTKAAPQKARKKTKRQAAKTAKRAPSKK